MRLATPGAAPAALLAVAVLALAACAKSPDPGAPASPPGPAAQAAAERSSNVSMADPAPATGGTIDTSGLLPTRGGKKPNILVIWGDDIGWSNISYNNRGLMGYQTPSIDRIAREGISFTDYYGQQSCTAGRAAFLGGNNPLRTGMTKVGLPGAKEGWQKSDVTIATVLKSLGYSTGQFGKNHQGDRDEHLPTMHGFDEFLGNLYHLNAEEEPENEDYPVDPGFRKMFGPRGVLKTTADWKRFGGMHFVPSFPAGGWCAWSADVCVARRNFGRHLVFPLHADICVICRRIGCDNLNPIIWHKIANASYEVANGSKFLGKPYEPNAIIKNDMEFILMQRKPGGYRQPSDSQRKESKISKGEFDRWFQQIWNIPGASTKHHPAPFPMELATRLVRMFSFTGDTVLDPFCGSGTTMIAALRTGRNSIGVEIDPEYCRMAARYLKAENPDLFSSSKLIFEKATTDRTCLIREDQELYQVRPAKKKLD